jgi:hypothetical protein
VLVTNLPSAVALSARERRVLYWTLERGQTLYAACKRCKVNPTRLRAKSAYQYCLQQWELGTHLKVAKARAATKAIKAQPADPAMDTLLAEIDARSPAAVPTSANSSEAQTSVSSDGCALTTPSSPSESVFPVPTAQDEANLSADARSARLAAALQRIEDEAQEAARARELNPPDPSDPHVIAINPPDPDYKPPTMWQIINAGHAAADQERYELARAAWIEKDRMAGPGSDYMSPSELSRYAKYREQ